MKRRTSRLALGFALFLVASSSGEALAGGERRPEETAPAAPIVSGTSVKNDVSPPLRTMPTIRLGVVPVDELEGSPVPGAFPGEVRHATPDGEARSTLGALAMPSPILNFDGISVAGASCGNCAPPSANGAVGATQYVQVVNTALQVFNKTTGASVMGPVALSTLWSGFGGVCQINGAGDPVVLYDQIADRWVVSQFAGTTVLSDVCVAVSMTSDATGSWFRYDFQLGSNSYDYPKLAVWPDAYYLATDVYDNSATAYLGPQPFALNRAAMLTGSPATFITFGIQAPALGFMLPGSLDGSSLPPDGAPNPWLSAMGATWPLYRFHVDFAIPANSTFTLGGNLTPDPYAELCPVIFNCVPQLGTVNRLDALANYPMFRLAYRRFGDGHEALVGTRTVDSGGLAGIRWWEIGNVTSGSPGFTQQGTYAPDDTWRWMGSAAMDVSGNLAIGFSASSSSIKPQIRYAGRLAADPGNTLAQGEETLFAGTGSQTNPNRWGDYNSLTVDPADECTFWYTNEYYATNSPFNWRTRIGTFKFPSCLNPPTFSVKLTPASQSVCAPADGTYMVNVGSVSGFSNPVTLSATGNPTGTTVSFSVNPVTPPGTSTMTIGSTGGAATGNFTIDVQGQTVDPIFLHRTAALNLRNSSPVASTLLTPANGASGQPLSPAFTWSAASQATTYTLEVATDAAFTGIVHAASGIPTTSYSGATLIANTAYYWRVRAVNACGTGSNSSVFLFSTSGPPGSCPLGTTPNIVYSEGFESGGPGWTHSGNGDTWALSAANPHGGTQSFFATDPATLSDQRLVSPALVLPAGNLPLVLEFWNWQHMETATGGCYDGGLLEVSTDGGSTWTQVGGASLLTDPYDGPISASFQNPIENLSAWCGTNPQPYLNSIVDIGSYAGQTVQFRFRLGSDNSNGRPGWYIDDVVIQNCACSAATPAVTAPSVVGAGSPNRTASVPFHAGSTYTWTITNGTITAGQGTSRITFTAGPAEAPLTLGVTEKTLSGCVSAPGSATVTVAPPESALQYYTVPPCRVIDTRSTSGFPAPYGPPSLPGVHAQRSFALAGQCGIPPDARAVSINATVWAPVTRGDMRAFPAGTATPTVAILNWEANIQALANAGILQLGTGRAITVQIDGPGTVDLILDVNGYFQ